MSDKAQVFTGDGIDYYQLATLKAALKMEKVGLKSRGGSLRVRWAATLGLKARDHHDKFIAEVQKRMEDILVRQAEAQAEGETKH